MLGFFSKKNKKDKAADKDNSHLEENSQGFFHKLVNGLKKTRTKFSDSLANLVLGKKVIDAELLEQLETCLLSADLGIQTTDHIISNLTKQVKRRDLASPDKLIEALKAELLAIIEPYEKVLEINKKPHVILVIGVNGAGKTTTIGKVTKVLQGNGKQVMLAAGDTFRAAAIEQLQSWGHKNEVPVISQGQGSDSASVIYDAFQSAKARGMDVLIADTAGRLHTQSHLTAELAKIAKVIKKIDADAPHEVLLVLDATIGQNALQQAKQFNALIPISGIVLTKLDGTAKGGIVFAIAKELKLPIKLIGVGEKIDDLRDFNAKDFVEALFVSEDTML